MNKWKCPACGERLGNYLYADACPKCQTELKYNTVKLLPPTIKNPWLRKSWLGRFFSYGLYELWNPDPEAI